MKIPNREFRPNPDRGIFVNAAIDQDLLDRLTPRIVALQASSRDPISIFIDSPGGSTLTASALGSLLRVSNQDCAAPCRIITVVTSTAASAAADLLSSGDYAIAYPDSTVFYHGVRTTPASPVTREVAAELSQYLTVRNESYALALARRSISRIIFLYLVLRSEYTAHRASINSNKNDFECFLDLLPGKLGPVGAKLVKQARDKNAQHDVLITQVSRTAFKKKSFLNATRAADREAILIKALVDFELKSNRAESWTFRKDGLSRIAEDFLLLIEFVLRRREDHIIHLCNRWADYFLTRSDKEELATIPEPEKQEWMLDRLRPQLQPLWFFCVSLCQALQEGENELTAEEAYWLGLLDEVIGAGHIPNMRVLVESQPGG